MESGARLFWKGVVAGVLTHDEKRFYCQTSFYTSRYCHVARCKTVTTKHWSISFWCWKRTNFLIVKVYQNDASVPPKFPDSILYDQCGVLKPLRRVFRHQASDKYFSRSYLHFRHFNYKTSSSLISTGRDGHESENLLQISDLIILKNERFLKEKGVKSFKRISQTHSLTYSSPSDLSTLSETVQTFDEFSGSRILSMRKKNNSSFQNLARGGSMTWAIRISRSDVPFLPLF